MDKLLQFLDRIVPLLPFYPPWARILFALSFLAAMLSIGVFVVMYPAASKRKDDMSERAAIGLNVSLLKTQNSTDTSDPLAVHYELSQEAENIVIAPRSDYLDLLTHGGPIHSVVFYDNIPFHLNLPTLDIKVVNNGKETLFFSGAVFEVDQSRVDREPVIVIPADVYNDFARHILLKNEGWGDVEKPALRFNVAPSTRPDRLEQPFTNELQCESFSESAKVDISQALNAAGADLERLSELEYIEKGTTIVTEGRDGQHETFTAAEYDRELNKALGPFADNQAFVEGEIEYETRAAPAGKRTVRFSTFVHLYNQFAGGAPEPPTYEYKVLLRTEGSNYSVPANISQAIKPGEPDRFTFRVAAQKSSLHLFRIRFIYNGQKELLSGPISLKVFMPRSAVGRITAQDK